MCSEDCVIYGDCCFDSKYYDSAQQRRAVSSFKCINFKEVGNIYVKQDCPSAWENMEIRRKCEKLPHQTFKDPLLMTPVTNIRNNITYGNIFCAVCNNDNSSLKDLNFWKLGFDCLHNIKELPNINQQEFIENHSSFNESDGGYWQVLIKNKYYRCDLTPILEHTLLPRTRNCVDWIKTCPATWNKKDTRDRCESHSLVVYHEDKMYRNTFCAICNNVLVQNLNCTKSESITSRMPNFIEHTVSSFSILFDFGKSLVEKCQPCQKGEIYNSLTKRCEYLMFENEDLNMCNCSRVKLNKSEFNFVNKGIYVHKYQKTYIPNDYRRIDDSVEICLENAKTSYLLKDKPYFHIITTFGIGISIICLCVHLITFTIVKELRNLAGRNLASMCAALLIAYLSFIFGNEFKGKLCSLNAIGTYYFFLAAFSWMLIISFDIWRSLKIATTELRVISGNQWRKFFIYSLCGWALPAKIVLIAVVVDLCPINLVNDRFKPHFGEGNACWFGNGQSLLIFFGLPVFIILICNLIFFLSSAFMIYSTQSMIRYSANPRTKQDFKLYARLALIMGMTWILGIVASFMNNEIFWGLFILCNTSTGLFIFLAFTCRKNVLHGLKNLRRDSRLNLPAFSWSLNNSENTKTSAQSEKHTTNTYY